MIAKLKPVLVASPVHRSGTTLLQRLLCSSPDALIFGESLANDLNMLISFLENKKMLLGGQDDWRAKQLDAVLQGDVNEWIPDIVPNKDWVIPNFENAIFQYLKAYADFAKAKKRATWGCKLPAWPTAILLKLLQMMPDARLLYIIRDLESCIRSAKLIGYCQDLNGVQQYAQIWKDHQNHVRHYFPKEQVMMIDYSRLCQEPAQVIYEIEQFAGVTSIDLTVMQHRINNYNRIHEAPPLLTEEERQLLQAINEN
ncbi:MAG: sulfotransferase [Saprospiraceae bacterium]|nr:sulfotransferase [Saprospiraceae bacterium]